MNKVKLSNSLQKFATTVYWQMVMSINLTNVFSIFIAVKRQGRKKAYLFWPIRSWTWTLKGWMDLKFWRNLIWLTHLWGRRCSEQKTPGRDTKKNKIKFILCTTITSIIFSREKELEKKKIYYYMRLKRQRRDFHEQIYKGQCCWPWKCGDFQFIDTFL